MPKFITVHRAPGLIEEEMRANAGPVFESKRARFLENYVNLMDGFIVTVYEAGDRDALVREFERLGFPYDEIHEVQISTTREEMAKRMGREP